MSKATRKAERRAARKTARRKNEALAPAWPDSVRSQDEPGEVPVITYEIVGPFLESALDEEPTFTEEDPVLRKWVDGFKVASRRMQASDPPPILQGRHRLPSLKHLFEDTSEPVHNVKSGTYHPNPLSQQRAELELAS